MLGGRLPLSMDLRLGYFYFFRVKDRKENRATSYMQNRMCLTKSHFLNVQGTLPKKPIRCSSRQVFFCEAPGCRRGGRGQALQSRRKAQAGTPACRPQRWTEERPPAPGDRCRKDRNQENEHSNQHASFLIKNMGSDAAGTRHFSPVGWAKIKGLIKAAVSRGERKRAPSCVDSAIVFTSTMNEETLGPRSSRPRNGGSELVHHFPPSINCRIVYMGKSLKPHK